MGNREFFNLVSAWSLEKRRCESYTRLLRDTEDENRVQSLKRQIDNSNAILEVLETGIHTEVDRVNAIMKERGIK